MDLTARNTNQLLLVNINGAAGTSTKATGSMIRTYTDLNDGQIAFTDPKGLTHAHGDGAPWATGNLFKIVVRNGTNLYWTPVLSGARSTVYPYVSYVRGHYYNAPVQQIDYIGYNGSTGSIEVINSNYYKIWIHLKGVDAMTQGSAIVKDGAYESTASDTQVNIAYELTTSLINNFKREPIKDIRFERVANGTYGTTSATWAVVYGSNTITKTGHGLTPAAGTVIKIADESAIIGTALAFPITIAGAADLFTINVNGGGAVNCQLTAAVYTSLNALVNEINIQIAAGANAGLISAVAYGNAIKFVNTTSGTTIAFVDTEVGTLAMLGHTAATFQGNMTTTPVYTVTAYTANTITLDIPYQSVTAADVDCFVQTVAPTSWGVKLTGRSRTSSFVVGKVSYSQPSWEVFIEDFGATTITNSITAVLGTGTGYQVAELEHFYQGFEKGNFTDLRDHLNTSRAHAVVTNNYDYITLSIKDEKAVSAIIGQPTSFSEIVIAANHGTASASIGAIESILDDYLGNIAIDA